MKVGRRLANKVLNASKFVLGVGGDAVVLAEADPAHITAPIDLALITQLAGVVDSVTSAFDEYRFDRALEHAEAFFWTFCDDYVELVKARAYGSDDLDDAATASARATLQTVLDTSLRLLAPFLPFVTEEVWSWWREGSIHRTDWPTAAEVTTADVGDPQLLTLVGTALSLVRGAKSTAQVSMRTDIAKAVVRGPAADLEVLQLAQADLAASGHIAEISFEPAESAELTVDVTM
jgi:valyl-tRNA synthetase